MQAIGEYLRSSFEISTNHNGSCRARVDAVYLLDDLQSELRSLTQAVFNGDLFHRRAKGLMQFAAIPVDYFTRLHSLLDAAERVSGRREMARHRVAVQQAASRSHLQLVDVLHILRSGYEAHTELAAQLSLPTVRHQIDCRTIDREKRHFDEICGYMEEIRRAAEPIASELLGLCVHGSLATNDYTDFSDTDDLVILKRNVFDEPQKAWRVIKGLRRTSCLFYRFDPYQHHRHIITTEFDLQFYSEASLPLETLRRAVWLVGHSELTIRCRASRLHAQRELGKVIQWFRQQWQNRRAGTKSAWHMKYYIATVLLVPVLVLQALGRPIYKGDSFREARGLFSVEEWRAVEMASELRAAWQKRLPVWQSAVRWPMLAILQQPLLHEQLMAWMRTPRGLAEIGHRVGSNGFQKAVVAFVEAAARLREESMQIEGGAETEPA